MALRYSKDFDQIMVESHTATLFGAGLPGDGLGVRCLAVGAMPEYTKDFGALVAGQWDEDNFDNNLIFPAMTLGVLRMKILTNMKCRLKNPSAVRQWRTRDTGFYLPQFPFAGSDSERDYMWRMSEFMVWEDESYPAFDFHSTVAQAASIVIFSGWRYALEKLEGNKKGQVPIWVNDWPSTRNK